MQDINEDMEDQFRKAVDQFALKPIESKWEELSSKIISFKRPSSLSDTIRSKYKKWFLLLALIFLLPVAVISLIPGFNARSRTPGQSNKAAVKKDHTGLTIQKTNAKQKEHVEQMTKVEVEQRPVSDAHHLPLNSNETASPVNEIRDKNENLVSKNKMTGLFVGGTISSSISEPAIKYSPADVIGPVGLAMAPVNSVNANSVFKKSQSLPLPLHVASQKNLPLQHLDYPRRQGFYLTLIGGPVLTEVEHQGLKKSGYDFGLLAGYTISKKFSIETGLIYTKQYFFVSGKYYNEIAGVDNTSSLEGNRNAFEIPLTLKYNIIRAVSGNFFVSAGTSTFVGVNDKILIHVADGTVPPSVNFNYGVTSYLPSYVNVGLGYDYKIGKFANVRIEPYLQIPLNSNTGNSFKTQVSGRSIQVFNTGIHFGISRFIR